MELIFAFDFFRKYFLIFLKFPPLFLGEVPDGVGGGVKVAVSTHKIKNLANEFINQVF